jgi:hypothetical protein
LNLCVFQRQRNDVQLMAPSALVREALLLALAEIAR